MTVPKKPRRKSSQRSSAKHRAHHPPAHRETIEPEAPEPVPHPQQASDQRPAQGPPPLEAFTQQWWSSWRRANALGWEYLDAASGVFRQNIAALASATRAWPRRT